MVTLAFTLAGLVTIGGATLGDNDHPEQRGGAGVAQATQRLEDARVGVGAGEGRGGGQSWGALDADGLGELVRWFGLVDRVTPSPEPVRTDGGEPAAVPPAAVSPAPVAVPAEVALDGLASIICRPEYQWDCATAVAVKRCEHGDEWGPNAIPNGNYGGFQLNEIHAEHIPDFWEHVYDPWYNTAWAYLLWLSDGGSFYHWGCG